MSFMDMLKKMDKAIDNGLAAADKATNDFERKYVRKGKEPLDLDKELDVLLDKGIEKVKPLASKVKDKACDLAGKAKGQVVAAKNKVMHKVEDVAVKVEKIETVIIKEEPKAHVTMAKIIDCSHKVPKMDLRAGMPKANPIPVLYRMQAFVDNAKDGSVYGEVR